ncbi:hypothetical protein PMAYCL1PPCAC_17724, partial [Pristionchus mayeri]
MALFDLQPVVLSTGERILPNASIKVKIVPDKDLPPSETSAEAEMRYRKAFKTDQVVLVPAEYNAIDYELENRQYSLPSSFVKAVHKTPEEWEETVEYDIDEEDLVWLEEENKRRELKKKKKIKEEVFELTIDRLEKETYFKTAPHEVQSMDGSESLDDDCCICGNGDVENTNQIIYCDMCNIAVHQECYGVPYIPDGQWLCRKCKMSPSEPVKCELCPLRDGAFKPTAEGKWAHVACAIWLNEVHFANTTFLEPIEGVLNSLRRRQKLRCLVCRVKMGACLQCSKGSCVKSFHVTCAMQAKLQMLIKTEDDDKLPDGCSVKRFVYCHVHGSVAVGENEFAKNKKRAIEAIHRARRRLLSNACSSTSAPVPTVDNEAKERIMARVTDKGAVEDVMGFWFYKRRKRCGLPLIRRLQVKKKVVARATTPRGEAKRRGRILYEKARLLVELVQKREKNKLENMRLERQMIPSLLAPLENILVEFINSLRPIDTAKFFHDDPVRQGLVNYLSIVKKPMDLCTMRKNAEKGAYENETEMKKHIDLIFKNCEVYNAANEGVLLYSRDTQRKMNKAYDDLVQYLKFRKSWYDELNLGEEPMKKEVKKELKEEGKETPTPRLREETNRRKRKAETPKEEEPPETPAVKRDKRTKEREKEKETPKTASFSVFAASTLAPIPLSSSVRRFSLDTHITLVDSNSNKSPRRMLTRGSTQPSFLNYRDLPSVMSPEMGVVSCESAAESDVETTRPESRSFSRASLSDPNKLHHGDLVKVNGTTAGQVILLPDGLLENPQLNKLIPKTGTNDIIVRHFTRIPEYAVYSTSCVAPLDLTTDKIEGSREARDYLNR